jgi:hypothetical protein
VNPLRVSVSAGLFLLLLGAPVASWAQSIFCESQNYQQQYCPAGMRITGARIISQQSNSPCIQGRTWGYDANGVWVNQGCSGQFALQGYRPGPVHGGGRIDCESRNYQREFCSSGQRIANAQLIEQRSQAPCIQGRTWGYQSDGVWVAQGCSAVFALQGGGGPPPRPGNRIDCESRDYQQNFCAVGARIGRAWVAEQRSQSPCIEGQTWGRRGDGIWVTQGCSAVFAFEAR